MPNEMHNTNALSKQNKYKILTKFTELLNLSIEIFYGVLTIVYIYNFSSYKTRDNLLFVLYLQFATNITILTYILKF